jgi:hypothetical protein
MAEVTVGTPPARPRAAPRGHPADLGLTARLLLVEARPRPVTPKAVAVTPDAPPYPAAEHRPVVDPAHDPGAWTDSTGGSP